MMDIGIKLVQAERFRQRGKNYTAYHDDHHDNGELAHAAEHILHALNNPRHQLSGFGGGDPTDPRNWHMHIISKWKHDDIRMLTITAALLVAEIERLVRAKPSSEGKEEGKS